MPIHIQHKLYTHPAAPVIRMVTMLYDRPRAPYRLDTFINVGDEAQRADYATLSEQARLLMLFYDERLAHRLSKLVPIEPGMTMDVLVHAVRHALSIPAGRFDFDRAKAEVMEHT